ncbi:MAG: signal peptidase I [Acidobacteriota bacterium]
MTRRSPLRLAFKIAAVLTLAILFLVALRGQFFDWYDVTGKAMAPTLLAGDRVVFDEAAYGARLAGGKAIGPTNPARGDIALFLTPDRGELFVKRVVGLPGETVEIRGGLLLIDGRSAEYDEASPAALEASSKILGTETAVRLEAIDGISYPIAISTRIPLPDSPPVKVPKGELFMLGDYRSNSRDSRHFGTVHVDSILGRGTHVAMSFEGFQPRWERFGLSLSVEGRPDDDARSAPAP